MTNLKSRHAASIEGFQSMKLFANFFFFFQSLGGGFYWRCGYNKKCHGISEMDTWYKFWSETWGVRVNLVNEKICRLELAAGLPFWIVSSWKLFMAYPYLKLHILFDSNGLAIWSGFPDITHIKKIIANNRPFCLPWPNFSPNLAQFRTHPS